MEDENFCKLCAVKLEKKEGDALYYCLKCSNYSTKTNESIINNKIKPKTRG
jgi:hypothetical protein